MIKGIEKLDNCDKTIKEVFKYFERIYSEVICTSGYRTAEENTRVGGAPNSRHIKGLAGDIIVPEKKAFVIAGRILENFPDIGAVFVNVFLNYVHFDKRSKDNGEVLCRVYDRNNKVI